MELIPLLVAATIGLISGIIAWLSMRGKAQTAADQARSESQTQIAVLTSQADASKEEVRRLQTLCADWERKSNESRDQLEAARKESAQLAERAGRVPELEKHATETVAHLAAVQDEISRTAAQLGERTQALEALGKRVASAEAAQQEERGRMEILQAQLREEAAKGATLAEQAGRIPTLEKELQDQAEAMRMATQQIADLREKVGASDSLIEKLKQQVTELTEEKVGLAKRQDQLLRDQQTLATEKADLAATLEGERQKSVENLALLTEAKEVLSNQFKALANDILEEKSKKFTEQNQTNLKQMLDPLGVKLKEFQGKVEEVYVQEGKERSALAEQVRHLMDLNKRLSDDAHNLTTALKGQSKTQGNWGEMVLEKILETAGLRKGHEYDVQVSHQTEDGARTVPDVVVHLPEGRHVIVDSKVSLTAYTEYVGAETEEAKLAAQKRHLLSIQSHLKGLSTKNYQNIEGVRSLDCVIMFVPIEPAYILAQANDSSLTQIAWDRNVMMVSPNMLMLVLRTIMQLWRQERQSQNVQAIAKRGAELYDKFYGFVEDLESIGERLKQAQKAYEGAHGKLTSGRGNLVGQAEKLKKLGIKPSKSLDSGLVELAGEEDGEEMSDMSAEKVSLSL